jgi:hypothetical protein
MPNTNSSIHPNIISPGSGSGTAPPKTAPHSYNIGASAGSTIAGTFKGTSTPGTITIPAGYTFGNQGNLGSSKLLSTHSIMLRPTATMDWASDSTITVEFNTIENSIPVNLKFEPEHDISVNELMRVMMLITAIGVSQGVGLNNSKDAPMLYIRKYGLERHFKFST